MQRRFVEYVLRGEINEGFVRADQFVQADFQQRIGDDLISGVGGTIFQT